MEIRIKVAMELLRDTSLRIYEISAKVGFDSPFYFSTCFKRVMGYAPNDYKTLMKTEKG